jgi:hypothetical protein
MSDTTSGDAATGTNGQVSLDDAAKKREEVLNAKTEKKSPTEIVETPEPTAGDLGIDRQEERSNPIEQVFADRAAAHAIESGAVTTADSSVQFSCHPISNLAIGPYQFTNSLLVLKPEEVAKFEELLDSMPLTESRKVFKVNTDRVDELIKMNQAQRATGTKDFDSSVGRDALQRLQGQFPKVGTERLGDTQTSDEAAGQGQG